MNGRRDFLRGLVSLPLIGGAVSLIGNPRAVAMPATDQLMFEYGEWLAWERISAYRYIHDPWVGWCDQEAGALELQAAHAVAQHLHGPRGFAPQSLIEMDLRSYANRWHRGAPLASTRAALVMATVGCDWRGMYR